MTGYGSLTTGRRGWLLAAQLLLVAAALLTLLTLLLVRYSDRSSSEAADECRRRREAMVVLPPEPDDPHLMVEYLVDHLTLPKSKPCQRELTLGGEPHEFSNNSVAVVGLKCVCLDPGFSLALHDCLVIASRPALEASFDAAAALFGCEVHSFGVERGRRLVGSRWPLPGGRRPVSVLALHLDGETLADLGRRPLDALDRVEQLTVHLNLTAVLTAGSAGDTAPLRRLYGSLLRLQEAGFHPYSSAIAEAENVLDVTLPGQRSPISTLSEVGWMKLMCDT
ncbi:uncharacterized protein LOC122365000 isoform X1 [Amphibalanus amphitrite]|uniref:uncharacterized protein LOC122365000 isoform X1 n=1 Tax=Amphibalanus amphitrite TaxID=1232801 RepID=UPI001C92B4E1|nr:uncharacterized protein LOC122365000 isoform X1 [Amphibalanus amphitrite]